MRFINHSLELRLRERREMQREGAALARLAFDPDVSAVAPHGVIHDRQPDAGALRAAAELLVDAVELPEDAALLAPRNADAVIAHPHDHLAAFGVDIHLDGARVARVLQRVGEEVLHRAFRGHDVGADAGQVGRDVTGHRELGLGELWLHHRHDVAHQLTDVGGGQVVGAQTGFHP
jgi:hypothetical protein